MIIINIISIIIIKTFINIDFADLFSHFINKVVSTTLPVIPSKLSGYS